MKKRTMTNIITKIIPILIIAMFVLIIPQKKVNADTIYDAKNASWGNVYRGYLGTESTKFYKITLPKSGLVNISFSTSSRPADVDIFYAKDMKNSLNYMRTEYSNNYGFYTAQETVPLLAGTYYVRVANWNGWYDSGNYAIKLTYASSKETYKETPSTRNDYFSTAKPMTKGKNYRGMNLYGRDTQDMYKISSKRKGTYKFTGKVNKGSGETVFFILNKNGQDVTSKVTGQRWISAKRGCSVNFSAKLNKGTYYLKAVNYSSKNYCFYSIKMK